MLLRCSAIVAGLDVKKYQSEAELESHGESTIKVMVTH